MIPFPSPRLTPINVSRERGIEISLSLHDYSRFHSTFSFYYYFEPRSQRMRISKGLNMYNTWSSFIFERSSIDREEFRFSRSTTRGSCGPTRKHSDGIVFHRGQGRGNGITLDLGLHGKFVLVQEKERKRGEIKGEREREGLEGRGETHGGEALLLTRKRNNSHRHANRTSIQNARSFLAALSTAIFVPPCLRAILRRDGNLSNRETILASIYKKRKKKNLSKKRKGKKTVIEI